MRRSDIAVGLVAAAIGIFVIAESLRLGLSQRGDIPGPGMFPLLVGASLVVVGAALAAHRALGGKLPDDDEDREPIQARSALRLGAVITTFAICIALLDRLGFLLSAFGFVLVIALGIERRPVLVAVTLALTLPALFYFIFVIVLGAQLPRGIVEELIRDLQRG